MAKRLVENQDYVVREAPFPNMAADGVVVSNPDGVCTIVINMNICPARKRKALKHELKHILNDDFYDDITPITEIEDCASGTSDKIIP